MPLLALEMERKNEMEFHALSDHDESISVRYFFYLLSEFLNMFICCFFQFVEFFEICLKIKKVYGGNVCNKLSIKSIDMKFMNQVPVVQEQNEQVEMIVDKVYE